MFIEKTIKIDDKTYTVASDDNYLDAMGSEFEPHMVQLFRALIGPNDVVVDIGANIGLTAILFSSLARQVYAFEPSPSTFNILASNLKKAGVANVYAVNLALGNKAETLTITFASNNRSGGYVSDKIRPESGHVTEEIRIDTLDRYFSNVETPPRFLKIDVEGFEQNVIIGGGEFLKKHKPTVVMEMNHFCLDVLQRITIPDFLDFMRSVFPYLYAVDTDNSTVINLHMPDQAYFVMHEHVVRHRFSNLVGGFNEEIKSRLDSLATKQAGIASLLGRIRNTVQAAAAKLVQGRPFNTPSVRKPVGSLVPGSIPATIAPSQAFEVSVSLTNASREIWHGYGTHPVFLSYHWLNADGSMHIYDGLRTPLSCESLAPEKTATETIQVITPEAKGQYQLVLTLVQEGVCWFEDKGFRSAAGTVEVK